jgi:hypothetical protein
MFFAQAGAQAEHELDAFEFVEPVLEGCGEFFAVGASDAGWAGGAELAMSHGTITIQGAVAEDGAEVEILGEEKGDGNPIAFIDADLLGQIAMLIAIDEAKIDLAGVGGGDVVEEGALLHAVAAPDSAHDQDVHLADEAGEQIAMRGGERDAGVEIGPAPLLLGVAGEKVLVVWQSLRKFAGKIFRGHETGVHRISPILKIGTRIDTNLHESAQSRISKLFVKIRVDSCAFVLLFSKSRRITFSYCR